MIIAKRLYKMRPEKVSKLNWKRMTHNYSEIMIDAYIDMQISRDNKISVCDMILDALEHDIQKNVFEEEIKARLQKIREMIENGAYSLYGEIERLTQALKEKDERIYELLTQLKAAHDKGDKWKAEDLLTKLVQKSILLGVNTANEVHHVLLMFEDLKKKHPKQFKLLENYLADPESKSKTMEEIKKLERKVDKGINKPTQIYLPGSVHNDYSHRLSFTGADQPIKLPDV